MKYHEKKENEKYLLYLIQQQRLISLEKLAENFNCSIRTVKRMISDLRNEGYDIRYCRIRNYYFIKK